MSLTLLDQRISNLEAEIRGYQEKLNDPSKLASHETPEMIVQMMHDASAYLTEVMKEKNTTLHPPQPGK